MSKIVNLRRARKARARDEKRAESARRTGTADRDKAEAEREAARHEGHRLDRDGAAGRGDDDER